MSNNDFIGYKIPLYHDENQKIEFNKYFGACRFVYNLCINLQEEHYQEKLINIMIKLSTGEKAKLTNIVKLLLIKT